MNNSMILFYVGNISWLVILISLIVALIYNIVTLRKEEREAK